MLPKLLPFTRIDVPCFVDTGLGHLSFGLFRGHVSKCGMDSPPVIVALDIGEQVSLCVLTRYPGIDRKRPTGQLPDMCQVRR